MTLLAIRVVHVRAAYIRHSALDTETERAVQSVRTPWPGPAPPSPSRTGSPPSAPDQIRRLDHTRSCEFRTHSSLLAQDGRYAESGLRPSPP